MCDPTRIKCHPQYVPLGHIAVENYEETEAMLALAAKQATIVITCTVKSNMVDDGAQLWDGFD